MTSSHLDCTVQPCTTDDVTTIQRLTRTHRDRYRQTEGHLFTSRRQ